MSQLLIQQYLNEIDRLRKFSGSVTEGVISEAFKDLLKAWSRQLNWQFAAQFEFALASRLWCRMRSAGAFRVPSLAATNSLSASCVSRTTKWSNPVTEAS